MDIQPLPIRLKDLLDARKVESDRVEFQAGWHPPGVLRSICAFANDFHNHGVLPARLHESFSLIR